MADAVPVAAPVAPPAPAAQPVAPAPDAGKPHHSATQPREVGKFAGPPAPAAPAAPKSWKLGDREVTDPEELYAYAREREVDAQAYENARQEATRLKAEAERWKDPRKALTAEQQDQIARERLEEFLRQEEEAKLPPAERAARQRLREYEAKIAEYENEKQQRARQEQDQAATAERNEAVTYVKATLAHMGDQNGDPRLAQVVLNAARAALAAGKQYPPDVLARMVMRQMDADAAKAVAALPVERVLSEQRFIDGLNAIEDPAIFEKLKPLLERARLHSLKGMGAAPIPQPALAVVPALAQGQEPRTTEQWIAYFQAGGRRDTPALMAQWNRLRDNRLL